MSIDSGDHPYAEVLTIYHVIGPNGETISQCARRRDAEKKLLKASPGSTLQEVQQKEPRYMVGEPVLDPSTFNADWWAGATNSDRVERLVEGEEEGFVFFKKLPGRDAERHTALLLSEVDPGQPFPKGAAYGIRHLWAEIKDPEREQARRRFMEEILKFPQDEDGNYISPSTEAKS
jgi:hypothetical protein